jgi:carbonic anhydrase/acetyltransferase-like protein (isoleucine patch superfamily)
MALILPVKGINPQIPDSCWLAPNASVIGQVILGENVSVWFQAVIRGDVNRIVIGDESNVQDGAVIHCTYQKTETIIGRRVSIAHHAIVHGCTIEDEVLIGMGAIVMDGAYIEKGSIVAAGAIVTQGTRVPAGSIYAGNPARFLKQVDAQAAEVFERTALNYQHYSDWFRNPEEEK